MRMAWISAGFAGAMPGRPASAGARILTAAPIPRAMASGGSQMASDTINDASGTPNVPPRLPGTTERSRMSGTTRTTIVGSRTAHAIANVRAIVQPAPPVRRSPPASGRSDAQNPRPSGPQSSVRPAANSGLRAARVRAS